MHIQYVRRHYIYIYCSFVKCTCAEMVTVLLKQKSHEVTLFGIIGADKCRYSRLHTSFWNDTVGRWLLQMKRSGLAPLWGGAVDSAEKRRHRLHVIFKIWLNKFYPKSPENDCPRLHLLPALHVWLCLTKVSFTRMEEWYGKGAAWLMITSAQIIATSHDVTIELRPNFLN